MEEETKTLPSEQPEAELPAPSFWEKLKVNKFKILAGVLGVFVFAGAVFGAYKLGQRQAQPTPQPTPTPAVVATPTPDPTADWKTYTNTKYEYSIKYPDGWILSAPEACIPSCPETADVMSSIRPPESKYPEGYFSITSWMGMTTEPQDAEAMRALARLWSWKASSEEQTTVDGSIAWVISGEMDFTDEKTYLRYYIIIERDGTVYEIDYWDTKTRKYAQTFNLMLSTFRFLEEAEGWKTLSNSVYKFSLKYPPNYRLKEWSPTTTVVYSAMLYDQKYESMAPQKPEIAVAVHKKDTPIFVSLDDFIHRDCREVKDLVDVTIGGKIGKQFICSDIGPMVTRAVVESMSYVYSISKVDFSDSNQTEIFNQILSTFRFPD